MEIKVLYRVHNQRNYKNTTLHTHTNRSLCECDTYMSNYYNDPQMKEVMDNFNKQTQQRFHEYDERKEKKERNVKIRAYGAHSMVQIAMTAAITASEKAGAIAGAAADNLGGSTLNTVLNGNHFKNVNFIVELIKNKYNTVCKVADADLDKLLCLYRSIDGDNVAYKLIETNVESAVTSGTKAAPSKTAEMTPIYTTKEVSKVTSTGAILSNRIIVSFIVIKNRYYVFGILDVGRKFGTCTVFL
nr:rifin PIR protein,putative [Plasmodium sp. DRC-Itaito]